MRPNETVKVGDRVAASWNGRKTVGELVAFYDTGITIKRPNGIKISVNWSTLTSLIIEK